MSRTYLVGAHEVDVEDGEAADEPGDDEGVDDEHEGQRLAGHGPQQRPAVAGPLRGDVEPGQHEDVEAQERGRRDEEEEEAVVSLHAPAFAVVRRNPHLSVISSSTHECNAMQRIFIQSLPLPGPGWHDITTHQADALADPGAVVVELLDAVVADGAVRRPRRPVQQARVAVLHPDDVAAGDGHVPGARQPEVRVVVRGARHHPLGRRRDDVVVIGDAGGVAVVVPVALLLLRRARVPRHDPGVPARCQEQERQILRYDETQCKERMISNPPDHQQQVGMQSSEPGSRAHQ